MEELLMFRRIRKLTQVDGISNFNDDDESLERQLYSLVDYHQFLLAPHDRVGMCRKWY